MCPRQPDWATTGSSFLSIDFFFELQIHVFWKPLSGLPIDLQYVLLDHISLSPLANLFLLISCLNNVPVTRQRDVGSFCTPPPAPFPPCPLSLLSHTNFSPSLQPVSLHAVMLPPLLHIHVLNVYAEPRGVPAPSPASRRARHTGVPAAPGACGFLAPSPLEVIHRRALCCSSSLPGKLLQTPSASVICHRF